MKAHRILLYEEMHEAGKALLEERAEIVIASSLQEEALVKEARDVDGIIVRANGKVSRRLIESSPRLKVIGRHGVGVENIDLEAATERGIWVVYTPDANAVSVAEHFFGLALMLSKMMTKAERALREEGRWEARYQYVGRELHGKTLGILGFGRIGKTIGRIGRGGFDMKILYYDALRFEETERELDAEKVELDELLRRSDLVSINLPMVTATERMISQRELALMKPTAYIINLARGRVWDEKALYAALKGGRIAGAGTDVFEVEPTPKDNPLLGVGRFIATPHMAAHTEESLKRMSMVAEDVIRVLDGKPPRYPVNHVDGEKTK